MFPFVFGYPITWLLQQVGDYKLNHFVVIALSHILPEQQLPCSPRIQIVRRKLNFYAIFRWQTWRGSEVNEYQGYKTHGVRLSFDEGGILLHSPSIMGLNASTLVQIALWYGSHTMAAKHNSEIGLNMFLHIRFIHIKHVIQFKCAWRNVLLRSLRIITTHEGMATKLNFRLSEIKQIVPLSKHKWYEYCLLTIQWWVP